MLTSYITIHSDFITKQKTISSHEGFKPHMFYVKFLLSIIDVQYNVKSKKNIKNRIDHNTNYVWIVY